MDVGMLWMDDDKQRSLEEKVLRAADYYRNKYGRKPNLCLVNQAALAEAVSVGRIKVLPERTVLPYHFWLGIKSS